MPGGDDFYDEFDEGVLETLGIIALTAVLAFLVYYRQQQQLNNRRAQEQGNPQAADGANGPERQEDRGFFPAPDDPEFMNWAAGGVGH